jgi:hypothetical protein
MRISEVPAVDVRGPLTAQLGRLLSLLTSLSGAQRAAPTAARQWPLDEGQAAMPAASPRISGEAAWRLLTGAHYDARQVQLLGDQALAGPLLRVRGIIV